MKLTLDAIASHRIAASRVAGLAALLLMLFTDSAWEASGVSAFLFVVGALLVGLAALGRAWCSLFISGRKDGELVTVGPYSVSRNPLYFFNLVGFVGIGFANESFALPVMFAALFAMAYPAVIRREEAFLQQRFGAAFDRYCDSVPRFWPSFSDYREPPHWQVRVQSFRRSLYDHVWFIWGLALVEAVEAFHEHGVLPFFLHVY